MAIPRVNAQLAMRCGSNRYVAGHLQRDGENVTQIVVCVLSNQVDAAGRAIQLRAGRAREVLPKRVYDFARRESQSKIPPKISSTRPHHKLTLMLASMGARAAGFTAAYTSRMMP